MLGIDPKDLPEIQEKYALELWDALQKQGSQKPESNHLTNSTPCNAEWIF